MKFGVPKVTVGWIPQPGTPHRVTVFVVGSTRMIRSGKPPPATAVAKTYPSASMVRKYGMFPIVHFVTAFVAGSSSMISPASKFPK